MTLTMWCLSHSYQHLLLTNNLKTLSHFGAMPSNIDVYSIKTQFIKSCWVIWALLLYCEEIFSEEKPMKELGNVQELLQWRKCKNLKKKVCIHIQGNKFNFLIYPLPATWSSNCGSVLTGSLEHFRYPQQPHPIRNIFKIICLLSIIVTVPSNYWKLGTFSVLSPEFVHRK